MEVFSNVLISRDNINARNSSQLRNYSIQPQCDGNYCPPQSLEDIICVVKIREQFAHHHSMGMAERNCLDLSLACLPVAKCAGLVLRASYTP
jgi:hypothetical protein